MKTANGDVFFNCKWFLNSICNLKAVVSHWKTIQEKGILSLSTPIRMFNMCSLLFLVSNELLLKCCKSNWIPDISEESIHKILHNVFGKQKLIMKQIQWVCLHLYSNWFLVHNNAPANSSLFVSVLITVLNHLLY